MINRFTELYKKRPLDLVKVLLLTLIFLPTISMSQVETPDISREALFERAFKSLSFVIKVANHDRQFMQSLTPEEIRMMEMIYPLVAEATTLNWLESKNFHKNTKNGTDYYSYVIAKDQPANITTPTNTNVKLQFLNDPDKFKLSTDEPPRDAMTANDMNSNIFINRMNINRPGRSITLGDAFSILIHEFGRKVEFPVIQSAIDSLGAKIKEFIDLRTDITELPNARVIVLKFSHLPFNEWFEPISFGIFKGVNIPNEYRPFEALDTQGTFVLIENNQNFTDLTDPIFQLELNRPIVQFDKSDYYHWAVLNWFASNYIELVPKKNNQLEIHLNLNQFQFVVPFWKPNSPNPRQQKPYLNSFKMQPHGNQFYGTRLKVDLKSKKPKIVHQYYDHTKYEAPQYQGRLIKKTWMKDDLTLTYEVTGEKLLKIIEDDLYELWPRLIIYNDQNRIEIAASSKEEKSNIYHFRLNDIRYANSGKLQVLGLELSGKDPLLTSPMPNTTVVGTLSETLEIPLEGLPRNDRAILKSIQGWNSQAWVTLEKKPQVDTQIIRFVFQSKSKIKKLSLLQRVDQTITFSTQIGSSTQYGKPLNRSVYTWIHFDESELIQNTQNDHLLVDVKIDKQLQTEDEVKTPVTLLDEEHTSLPSYVKNSSQLMPSLLESMSVSSEGVRQLIKVSVSTESLQSYEITFPNPLQIKKDKTISTADSSKAHKIKSCRSVIKKTN